MGEAHNMKEIRDRRRRTFADINATLIADGYKPIPKSLYGRSTGDCK